MGKIEGYHAHVYFDEKTIEVAREVCEFVQNKFEIKMGTMHEKPIGPHPMWSCQLSVDKVKFGRVIPWLAVNRKDLIIFIHPETGDDLLDHTDHAIWMGKALELNLKIFV